MDRIKERLHDGYLFRQFPIEDMEKDYSTADIDDSTWQPVCVPHDWAIGRDFAEDNDLSYNKVVADGIVHLKKHTGRTGALPTVGIGWYRRALDIPAKSAGKRIELIFDGVMWESVIYLNGVQVGCNHFGYRSFMIDITDAVIPGKTNFLAVKAIVKNDCSRWYSGAGIFRNVYLVTKSQDSIAYCGIKTQIETDPEGKRSKVELSAELCGAPDSVEYALYSPDGEIASSGSALCNGATAKLEFIIGSPELWSTVSPNLYVLAVKTRKNGEITDSETVNLGFRSCVFTPDRGFFLNGKQLKLNGVCMHHDLGVFGAAVNKSALRRQMEIMREMGVNSIRTSHNPPSPELLDICDEMGLLVMDEFFDEWKIAKVKNGYAQYFDEHAEADVVSVIRRDINHPSVFMWSIGNEIPEQRRENGAEVAHFLTDICHREDPTRPTTAALNTDLDAEKYGFFDAIDLVGLNYKPNHYKNFHEKYPNKVFYGAETESCVSTRGEYKLPAVVEIPAPVRADLTVSDYGLSAPSWAYYADRELVEQQDDEFILGEYVWTGFDYLGEPTPYYEEWPSRSSYFGIFDTAGLPKSRYYQYKEAWTDDKVLFAMPHLNLEGHDGELVPFHIITSYDRVELILNGVSYGIRAKSRAVEDLRDKHHLTDLSDVKRCRIIFDNVPYAHGEMVLIARGDNGEELDRAVIRTAGGPFGIMLSPERSIISADGEDACFIRAAIVDKSGNICPTASNEIKFEAKGSGYIYATDNGDQRDTVGYFSPARHALNGQCVAVVRADKGATGEITVTATAEGLIGVCVAIGVE